MQQQNPQAMKNNLTVVTQKRKINTPTVFVHDDLPVIQDFVSNQTKSMPVIQYF